MWITSDIVNTYAIYQIEEDTMYFHRKAASQEQTDNFSRKKQGKRN